MIAEKRTRHMRKNTAKAVEKSTRSFLGAAAVCASVFALLLWLQSFQYWQFSTTVLCIIFIASGIALRKSSATLQVNVIMICATVITTVNSGEIVWVLKQGWYLFQKLTLETVTILLGITAGIVASALIVWYIVKNIGVIASFAGAKIASAGKRMKNYIMKNKKVRYFLIFFAVEACLAVVHTSLSGNISLINAAVLYFLGFFAALAIGMFFNESIKEIRKHPYILAALGGIGCLFVYLILSTVQAVDNSKIADELFNPELWLILSAIWALTVLVLCKEYGFRTLLSGILLITTLLAAVLCFRLKAAFPHSAKKIWVSTVACMPTIYFIAAAAVITVRGKWHKVKELVFKEPVKVFVFPLLFVFLWTCVSLLIGVVRWNMFSDPQNFWAVLVECALFTSVALLCITVICGMVFVVIYVSSKLFSKNGVEMNGRFLSFYVCLALVLILTIYLGNKFNFMENPEQVIEEIKSRQELSFIVIIYANVTIIFSYIISFFIHNVISANVIDCCNKYLKNEALTQLILEYNSAARKHGNYSEASMVLKNIFDEKNGDENAVDGMIKNSALENEQRSMLKYIVSEKNFCFNSGEEKSEKGKKFYLPDSFSSIIALYIADFVFKLRDTIKEILSDIFGTLKPNGIVLCGMKELLELFVGGDENN